MPLLELWKATPAAVEQMTIEQIVGIAGNGRLTDGSECSVELRDFLRKVDSGDISRYIEQCLIDGFSKSGLVLQDLVNELGRRLDFSVRNGRYQGKTDHVGFDGLWSSPELNHIVVEVKTTDAYRISLDTIAKYRTQLLDRGVVEGNVSILIVVGRQDTGDLEAQVRGSRYAWDVRLISTDALIKLVMLKESTEEDSTLEKIRGLLRPVEYTRVDRLVDVLITATQDVEASVETERGLGSEGAGSDKARKIDVTDPAIIQAKREQILECIEKLNSVTLIRKSRATYWDSAQKMRVACTISKRYENSLTPYWYAYHPSWDKFLHSGEHGIFALGCVDSTYAYAIPVQVLRPLLPKLNITERKNGNYYWHIHLVEDADCHALWIPGSSEHFSLKPFLISLQDKKN